jgi:hypothetical protein
VDLLSLETIPVASAMPITLSSGIGPLDPNDGVMQNDVWDEPLQVCVRVCMCACWAHMHLRPCSVLDSSAPECSFAYGVHFF